MIAPSSLELDRRVARRPRLRSGRAPRRRARRDQAAQARPRADRSSMRRRSARRSSRPTRSRRRRCSVSAEHLAHAPASDARDRLQLGLRERLHRRARRARRARDRAASRSAARISLPTQVVVASTGVIGVPLPMDRVQRGLERAVAQLEDGGKAAYDAAEAIMTTDRVPKLAAYAFYRRRSQVRRRRHRQRLGDDRSQHGDDAGVHCDRLSALARGAGAALLDSVRRQLQHDLGRRRHVDQRRGLRVCAGAGDGAQAPPACARALRASACDLAQAMVADGEGATKIARRCA